MWNQSRPPKLAMQSSIYLLIIILILFTLFKSNLSASGFSLPLYVAVKLSHFANTFSPSVLGLKSYSQLIVLCSRPLGLFGRSSSFSIKVYCFPSAFATSSCSPSYFDKSQVRSSPVVRCDANPAPPSVSISRLPRKTATDEGGLKTNSDLEDPPRTRSSESVQSIINC